MGSGLRENWALVLALVLAGDLEQSTSPPSVAGPLIYHMMVLLLTSQNGFEES